MAGALFAALLALAAPWLSPELASGQSAPAVTGVAVSSTPNAERTYALGERIRIRLTFSEAVDVTGTPRLKIGMDPAHGGQKWAVYKGGSGKASLNFVHVVVEPNISTQGIAVLSNTLELNGGTIRSVSSGDDADLAHAGLAHDPNHKVDWRRSSPQPKATSTATPTPRGTLQAALLGTLMETLLESATGPKPAPEPTWQPLLEPAGQPPASPTGQAPFRPTGKPPTKPTGLKVRPGNGSLSVSVDWNDVPGALHYKVRWREAVRGTQLNSGVAVTRSNATISVAHPGTWVVKVFACRGPRCGPGKSTRLQVEEVDEAPTITDGPTAFSFAERGTAGSQCCQEGRLCHPSGLSASLSTPPTLVATYTATDPENDTIVWSVEGTDATKFTISAGGALSFKAAPDFESPGDADSNNTYLVAVRATANGKSDTRAVTVTITDGNDRPSFVQKKEALEVEEGYGHYLYDFGATDPQGNSMTFSLAGPDSDAFTYEHIHKLGTTCYAALNLLHYSREPDYEQPDDADKDGVYSIIVRVTDGALTTDLPITVTVTDVDEAPEIEGLAVVDFAENSTADVGEYTAMDPEGETATLHLGGTDATSFTLTNGVLTFKSAPDFETKRSYSVTVTASDGTNESTLAVAISITNVVEPGE